MADILPVSQMIQQPNLLGGFQQGLQFGQAQRDRRNSQQAAQLYAQAMQAPVEQRPALLAQIAQLTGVEGATTAQAGLGRQDSAAHDDLVQSASQFAAIAEADPATAQQMYPALAAKAHAVGIPVPTTYDPRFLPAIQKLATIGSPGGAVQSTYVDTQGNRVAVMRDGSHQVIGQNAPNMQIIDNGQGFYGVNKSNLAASPVTLGGAPQQAAPTQFTGADGRPVQIDPSLPPAVQASIRANEGAYAQAPNMATAQIGQLPQQLRSMPKPADIRAEQSQAMQIAEFNAKQSHTLSPAEVAAAGLPAGTVAQTDGFGNLKVVAAAGSKNADPAKAEKLAAARADALDSVNQAIGGIDSLMHSGGFQNLGTFTGDVLGHIPHTQTRDAQNALETVKNQVLLTTLGKLKALSATGASGFGALSNQEGKILQNSIANLETAQTHDAIVHNLRVIQQTLQRAAGLIGQGVHAPAAPAGGWSIQEVR
jgi:hypothetical protein